MPVRSVRQPEGEGAAVNPTSEHLELPEIDPSFRGPDQILADLGTVLTPASELPIEEINPANPHLFRDHVWPEHFARLRADDPVHLNEIDVAGRYWSVTRYDDIRAIDGDWQTFSSDAGLGGIQIEEQPKGMERPSFIRMDPPRHDAQRKTVRSVSSPGNLRHLEPLIRQRTIDVLESLPDEPFDWVDTVSIELTTTMLASLFEFPMEDRRKLTRWSDIVFAVPVPGGVVETIEQKLIELRECYEHFEQLWEQRREAPGDDLVSMLVHGDQTKEQTALDHLGTVLLLIVGGNDTTRNTMTGSVYGMHRFPEQFEKLVADPGRIDDLVPEVIRWQTPLAYMRRTATRDCELGGKQIRKNDQVLMCYASANRDEAVFPNGDAIDLDRPNADRHLSFGYGIHFCMGSRLAELQLRILWEELLPRFSRIEVLEEPGRSFSSFTNGYTDLLVRAHRRGRRP